MRCRSGLPAPSSRSLTILIFLKSEDFSAKAASKLQTSLLLAQRTLFSSPDWPQVSRGRGAGPWGRAVGKSAGGRGLAQGAVLAASSHTGAFM